MKLDSLGNFVPLCTGSQKELIMAVFMLPGDGWKEWEELKFCRKRFSRAKNESITVLDT